MLHLFLDESGDLGFDFVNKKPSKFFTVAVLAINGSDENRKMAKVVKMVLRRKLNPRNKRKRVAKELKGEGTNFEVKKYFFKKAEKLEFNVYSVTLNKLKFYGRLAKDKAKIYNYVSRKVLSQIPFDKAGGRIILTIDKSKGAKGIREFNSYIICQLKDKMSSKVPFDIYHEDSKNIGGLQAVDLFAWGIHRKYEQKDLRWFRLFIKKIALDEQFFR